MKTYSQVIESQKPKLAFTVEGEGVFGSRDFYEHPLKKIAPYITKRPDGQWANTFINYEPDSSELEAVIVGSMVFEGIEPNHVDKFL